MNLTPSAYKANLKRTGLFAGQAKKNQADTIMEAGWYEDLATRRCYLYDIYHDNEPTKLNDLSPEGTEKIPVDLRYIVNGSQTYDKDVITQHVMFKPSEEGRDELVPYYKESFINRYSAQFPVGLYCDVPDAKGNYNRWLVVDRANFNDPQFPTYEILRCDYLVQYVFNGVKYQIPAVLRSQNSYNSGIWRDYLITTVENQYKFAVPLNRDTENLFYRLRLIIDNKVETEPICWQITKVNRIAPNGVARITLAQDLFDSHKDFIERNEDGEIIGMWGGYYENNNVLPVNVEDTEPISNVYCKVVPTGKPVIKMNDSWKKFTVDFYREGESINYKEGKWTYSLINPCLEDDDPNKEINATPYIVESPCVDKDGENIGNQIKIKFKGGLEFLNWILKVTFTESETGTNISASTEANISRL